MNNELSLEESNNLMNEWETLEDFEIVTKENFDYQLEAFFPNCHIVAIPHALMGTGKVPLSEWKNVIREGARLYRVKRKFLVLDQRNITYWDVNYRIFQNFFKVFDDSGFMVTKKGSLFKFVGFINEETGHTGLEVYKLVC